MKKVMLLGLVGLFIGAAAHAASNTPTTAPSPQPSAGNGGADTDADELALLKRIDPDRIHINESCPTLDEAILHLRHGIERVKDCCELRARAAGQAGPGAAGGPPTAGTPSPGPVDLGPKCQDLLDFLGVLLKTVEQDRKDGHCYQALHKLHDVREKLPDLDDFCGGKELCKYVPRVREEILQLHGEVKHCFDEAMEYAQAHGKRGECGRALFVLERVKAFLLMAHRRCERLNDEFPYNGPLPGQGQGSGSGGGQGQGGGQGGPGNDNGVGNGGTPGQGGANQGGGNNRGNGYGGGAGGPSGGNVGNGQGNGNGQGVGETGNNGHGH